MKHSGEKNIQKLKERKKERKKEKQKKGKRKVLQIKEGKKIIKIK